MGELGPLEVVGPGLSDRPGNRLSGAVTVEGGLEVYRLNNRVSEGSPGPGRCRGPRSTPWGQRTGSGGPAEVQWHRSATWFC